MEKKEYIKPEMKVYQIETPSILAGSEIETAKENDYGDENVSNGLFWFIAWLFSERRERLCFLV